MIRKIIFTIVTITITLSAQSQTIADQLRFSRNTLVDTNAVGIVTVGSNPATGSPALTSVAKTLLKWNTTQIRGFNDSVVSIVNSYDFVVGADTINKWKPIGWQPNLTNYYTKAEVDALIPTPPNLSLYVKYSDTASMLTPYLKKSVANSMYQTVENLQTNLTASAIKYPSVDAVNTGLATKQATLVSGTNIKTVNGATLLGSGNISTNQNLSLSGKTLSISGGNSVTLPSTEVTISYPSRAFNTNFDILNNTIVNYSIEILNGTALVSATSATASLEYSVNGGSSWITISEVAREENGLSLISLVTKGGTFILSGTIPAGCLARIRTAVQAGSSVTLVRVQETNF